MQKLKYETLERIPIGQPVSRVEYIASACADLRVLDIGCLDETALGKRGTSDWLHAQIASKAAKVTGVDLSDSLPPEGLETAPNAVILKADGTNPPVDPGEVDIVVAGEFIEHLENPLQFLKTMRERYAGRELLISTPNGASFANAVLALKGSEAQHPDHLLTSTFKTLNTLCLRAGVSDWQIIPYRFYATEMLLGSKGVKRVAVRIVEKLIRVVESLFPLRAFGYVVRIRL